MIRVRPVRTRGDLDQFVKLPWTIYSGNPHWVPPLLNDVRRTLTAGRNPFWHHASRELFLAESDGKVVGRIAGIVDRNYNTHRGSRTGFFGFFESVNDPDVARGLLDSAVSYCARLGMDRILGPANPSLNDEAGMLVHPFDSPPMVKMSYNPSYYPALVEAQGLTKAKDLYAYVVDVDREMPAKLTRVMEKLKKRSGIKVRPLDLRRLAADLNHIKDVYNDAWSENWDFAPMTEEEIDGLASQLRPVVKPEICPLVFCDGEIAGMSIALPDYNQVLRDLNGRMLPLGWLKFLIRRRSINQLRVWALGVKRRFRSRGLDSLLYYESFLGARKLGYRWGEVSWILEDNTGIIRPIGLLGGEVYKRYRIYGRAV